ncbi:MAG: hypothetical protein JWL83_3976 [Actinomycetia bacterium]|nr:hypothetical protein [Actinomycetes bacterium]
MHTSPASPLARLLVVESAALAALAVLVHPLGAADAAQRSWWVNAPVPSLAGTLGWWIAFALASWCAITTITCVASRAFPALRALRVLDVCTAPAVRRAVDRALALSLALGTISTVAVAGAAMPASATTTTTMAERRPPVVVRVTPDGKIVVEPGSKPSATTATTAPTPTTTSRLTTNMPPATHRRPASEPRPPKPPEPAATAGRRVRTPARPDLYTVVPGDNLWHIAAARLAAANRRVPTDEEIAPYWQRVVAANRSTLRSGDPNLIFAGELVTLPPLA